MKPTVTILFLLISATLMSQQVKLSQPVRFLALGDSYSAGTNIETSQSWPNQLYDRLAEAGYKREKIEIIARAGWRTDNLAKAIKEEKISSDFNLVSLMIGVNDQYQGIAIDIYEVAFENLLKTAINLAGGNTNSVFVLSIPDYEFTPFGQGFVGASEEIDRFNDLNREVTQKYGISYFDITPLSRLGLENPGLLSNDGLHPTGEMYKLWTDIIIDHIRSNNLQENSLGENKFNDVISIFPNPVSDNVSIKIFSEDVSGKASVSIYSLSGELKHRINDISFNGSDTILIELPTLAEGFYLFEIITDSDRTVKKIFITGGGVQ